MKIPAYTSKEKVEGIKRDVEKHLYKEGFKKTWNPLDRLHGYQMKRSNDEEVKVGINISGHVTTSHFTPEIFITVAKVKRADKKVGRSFFEVSVEKVLNYIKENI